MVGSTGINSDKFTKTLEKMLLFCLSPFSIFFYQGLILVLFNIICMTRVPCKASLYFSVCVLL